MDKNFNVKNLVIGGLLLAVAIIVPSIFHSSALPGNIFLPMHIPILIGGFILPPGLSMLLGGLTPVLNSLITGMPKIFPNALIMLVELGAYGFFTSYFSKIKKLPTLISLILAMLIGRIFAGLMVFILASLFGIDLDPILYVIASVTKGFPGILIQIFLVPSLVYLVNKHTNLNF